MAEGEEELVARTTQLAEGTTSVQIPFTALRLEQACDIISGARSSKARVPVPTLGESVAVIAAK